MQSVGLEYLTLSRSSGTLSGGESQRIRLATQIGSSLMGVLYILDEPSIGLHQRDNDKLLNDPGAALRDLGNTLIVVESTTRTPCLQLTTLWISVRARDATAARSYFEGTVDELLKSDKSITGQYLSGKNSFRCPKSGAKATAKASRSRAARSTTSSTPTLPFRSAR